MKQSSTNQSVCIFTRTIILIIDRTLSFNSLTPMSDQEKISSHSVNAISSRQMRRIKKKTQLGDYKLIQYQILQTNIIRIVWRRITNEISGVKGLVTYLKPTPSSFPPCPLFLVSLSILIFTNLLSLNDVLDSKAFSLEVSFISIFKGCSVADGFPS